MGIGNIFAYPRIRRVSRNRWDDQQIEENDGSFVITKDIYKFQKFGIRV